jgi:hypothetical protein
LRFPTDIAASQQEVLRRIAAAEAGGLVAHIRVLVAFVDDEWRPICGRIDVARPEDAPKFPVRPKTSVRLLVETVSLSALAERLESAFLKQPFLVQGENVVGHGMEAAWGGEHHPDDWAFYGAQWPVFMFCPTQGVSRPVLSWEAIEAEGAVHAIDGTEDCVRFTMGLVERTRGGGRDVRFSRFQIVLWDYRGVVRSKVKDGHLHIEVKPRKDAALTLSVIVGDNDGKHTRKKTAPTRMKVPIAGVLRRVNITLRSGAEIVHQALWDKAEEEAIVRLDGRPRLSPSAPTIVEPEPISTVSRLVMGFLTDATLGAMVVRDMEEIDAAIKMRAYKAAVLLSGSVLEAALLDVVGRNEREARNRLKQKWPERASLKDLIDYVSGIQVQTAKGVAPLMSPLTGKKGLVVTDHRDLIHPRAEVRALAKLDEHVATTMRGVLGEVIRDLQHAHKDGLLDAYANGNVVP